MEPYLYQTIHLCDGRARLLDGQLARLERAAERLFGVTYRPDRAATAERLLAVARRERYPAGLSGFVRIEVTASGEERLRPCGASLYAGYALRPLHPAAVTLRYERLLTEFPTSASEAADRLAQTEARRRGADEAIRCDAAERCRAIGDAPLFALRDGVLYGDRAAADEGPAEAEALWEAAAAVRIRTVDGPLLRSELNRFDELFTVDHRGLTALSRCDGRPCMVLAAERLARGLEAIGRAER